MSKRIKAAEAARKAGDHTFTDAEYPRADWIYEVNDGDTQLGYFDWVIHQLDAAGDGSAIKTPSDLKKIIQQTSEEMVKRLVIEIATELLVTDKRLDENKDLSGADFIQFVSETFQEYGFWPT